MWLDPVREREMLEIQRIERDRFNTYKTYFEKNPNGQFLACVKCGHGRQNHDDKFRESARANEEQSQKRDVDFG